MTNVSELVGEVREITLGNTTLKVRQLKIKELFSHFENSAVESKINEAKKISENLCGDDKVKFMLKVWDTLPKGEKLTNLATEIMTTMPGVIDMIYMAAKDLNKDLTEDHVKGLVSIDNIDDVGSVVAWISGFSDLPDITASIPTEVGEDKKK